ncbi:rhodanese-like domain-containing protein [Stutzerimonas kunmingensis]|uniref:rhodanese-like domain-containing protein n=1 Tax=Stutzerimonas kunmingensis TaxID=1211807 RepID=UPI001FE3DF53|nr:rhodanese-like domain-containing protein [Stutzerimonas kunmingensis]
MDGARARSSPRRSPGTGTRRACPRGGRARARARHAFVAHLPEGLEQLDKDRTVATYCGSGYRASIAASILKREGFRDVVNVPGSWLAWQKHDLPVAER